MKMNKGNFGTLQDGRSAQWLEIENDKLRVRVSDYGATLVSLWVKDAQLDAVLGFCLLYTSTATSKNRKFYSRTEPSSRWMNG